MRIFSTMIQKILLIFGIASCAVFMSGCIPVYAWNTYWGEFSGRLTDLDGNPLPGVHLEASYGSLESEAMTNANGEFVMPALRHVYYIAHLGGPYPPDPNKGSLFSGYMDLKIKSPKDGIDFLILWYVRNYEGVDYYIYLIDYNTLTAPSYIMNHETWEPIYTRKYLVNFPSPHFEFRYNNIKIHFNSDFMKCLKKERVPEAEVSNSKPRFLPL